MDCFLWLTTSDRIAWKRTRLLEMRERVAAVSGFERIEVDDHDLFDDVFSDRSTVADWLSWLERRAELGEQFTTFGWTGTRLDLRSVLDGHIAFLDQRLAFVFALLAADEGALTMNGASYDAVDTLLVDVGESIRIETPDPQNLSYEEWNERMGGIDAHEKAHAAWRKSHRR